MDEFISEDELKKFDGWLKYQAIDGSSLTAEQLEQWRTIFEETRRRSEANPKVGLMKLQPVAGEHRYAVAVRESNDLWLTLWVRRSQKGEFFVMHPVGDRDWDPHTSYHLDGNVHMKSYDQKVLPPLKRQPLTGRFRGAVDLGINAGHAPKSVGAVCDPSVFSGVVEVPSGVLGPKHGSVAVALVESGHPPPDHTWGYTVFSETVFRDTEPNVVITILQARSRSLSAVPSST